MLSSNAIWNGTEPTLLKDTTMTKIFVGGLPYHTTDESLRAYFEQYGSIEEAVVITDRHTGKSRGYGFVTMKRSEDAALAVRDANPCIDGRKANVNLAVLGAKPRNVPGAVNLQMPTVIQPQQPVMPTGLMNLYSPNRIMSATSNPLFTYAVHSNMANSAGLMNVTMPYLPSSNMDAATYFHLLNNAGNLQDLLYPNNVVMTNPTVSTEDLSYLPSVTHPAYSHSNSYITAMNTIQQQIVNRHQRISSSKLNEAASAATT